MPVLRCIVLRYRARKRGEGEQPAKGVGGEEETSEIVRRNDRFDRRPVQFGRRSDQRARRLQIPGRYVRAVKAMRLQLISGRLLLFRFVRAQDGRGAGGSEEKHGEEEKRHEGKGEFFDNARTG